MKIKEISVALGLSMACLLANAQFVVVVSPKSSITALSAEQVSQIFLGKVATFPGGEAATPVDLPEGGGVRNQFYDKVTNKSPKQVLALRANMIFSGKGKPPRELASSQDVKKALADGAGSIGYIEKAAADDTVRIVFTQP